MVRLDAPWFSCAAPFSAAGVKQLCGSSEKKKKRSLSAQAILVLVLLRRRRRQYWLVIRRGRFSFWSFLCVVFVFQYATDVNNLLFLARLELICKTVCVPDYSGYKEATFLPGIVFQKSQTQILHYQTLTSAAYCISRCVIWGWFALFA